MTIQEGLDGWYLHLKAQGASYRTIDRYDRVWRQFTTWLTERGVTELEALKPELARLYILNRMAKVSPITAHYEVTPIKSFTAWLEQMEFISSDPFRRVKKPRVERKELQILKPAEVKTLLSVLDQKEPDEFRDYVIISLVLATGLRRGEITGALLKDFDPESRSLLVMGKGRKQRRVPIPPDVVALIWRYIKTVRKRYANPVSTTLFITNRGGPVNPGVMTHRFQRYVQRAEIDHKSTFHGLRHWAASAMLANSMPLELVSRTLGHADAVITSRVYAHVGFNDIQRAFDSANHLRQTL